MRHDRLALTLTLTLSGAMLLAVPATAHATTPGRNGLIAFSAETGHGSRLSFRPRFDWGPAHPGTKALATPDIPAHEKGLSDPGYDERPGQRHGRSF